MNPSIYKPISEMITPPPGYKATERMIMFRTKTGGGRWGASSARIIISQKNLTSSTLQIFWTALNKPPQHSGDYKITIHEALKVDFVFKTFTEYRYENADNAGRQGRLFAALLRASDFWMGAFFDGGLWLPVQDAWRIPESAKSDAQHVMEQKKKFAWINE